VHCGPNLWYCGAGGKVTAPFAAMNAGPAVMEHFPSALTREAAMR